jgi:hypothetical protein
MLNLVARLPMRSSMGYATSDMRKGEILWSNDATLAEMQLV